MAAGVIIEGKGATLDHYDQVLAKMGRTPRGPRARIRYERYPEIHTALLVLACSILCWRRLRGLLAQTPGGC